MAERQLFEGRRNRLTDVEGRGGVEIRERMARIRSRLREVTGLEAVMVDLLEDDVRETAASIAALEDEFRSMLIFLEKDPLTSGDLLRLAESEALLDRVDYLRETVETLRRRLIQVADRTKDATE